MAAMTKPAAYAQQQGPSAASGSGGLHGGTPALDHELLDSVPADEFDLFHHMAENLMREPEKFEGQEAVHTTPRSTSHYFVRAANSSVSPRDSLESEDGVPVLEDPVLHKLQRAMEIIRETELDGSQGLESDNSLVQIWIPDREDGALRKNLRNVVVGCTTRHNKSSQRYRREAEKAEKAEDEGEVTYTLSRFGERSKLYKFQVEGGMAEGLPGRVFVSGRPEMTLDVQRYGKDNYLRIHEAASCGIRAAVGMPVYSKSESGSRETVAVVEISKVSAGLNMERLSCKLADVFERVDLRTWGRDIGAAVRFANWPFNVHVQRTGAILNTLVEAACQLPGIEYVACWGKFTGAGTSAGLIPPAAGSNDQRQLPDLLTCDALPCGVQHPLFIEYRKACSSKLVYEGYGFVGNAWSRNCSVWNSCVSQIPWQANPYSYFNVSRFLGGVVAVPITLSRAEGGREGEEAAKYVLEIFITERCRDVEVQRQLIVRMLTDLLKMGGGRFDIGVRLDYLELGPAHNCAEPLVGLDGVVEGPGPAESEGGGGDEDAKEVRRRRGNAKKKDISLEQLQQYFKYNLKEAANKLGVCPTTLKRVCRQYNIPRWPCRKLKKVNRSINRLQNVVENVPGVNAAAIGFPDLKAACVFDTSIEGSQSAKAAEGPLLEVSSGAKRRCRTVEADPGLHGLACAPTSSAVPIPIPGQAYRPPPPPLRHVGSRTSLAVEDLTPLQMAPALPVSPRAASGFDMQASCGSPLASPRHLQAAAPTFGGVTIKATHGDSISRFSLYPGSNFEELKSRVKEVFGLGRREVKLKYLDGENDLVCLQSDGDLWEAVLEAGNSQQDSGRRIVRVRVEEDAQ